MSLKVKNYSEIDVSSIEFADPKKTRSGSYLVEMYFKNNNQREDIYIQTPKLKNINELNINDNNPYLEFEFNSKSPEFYDFITKIDEHCILNTHKNSKEWFKQPFPLDFIDECYKSNIRPSRNNNSPTIRFKLPVSKKQLNVDFYNSNKEKINLQDIKNNSEIISVVKLVGMKFLKKQFILEFCLVQGKVCQKEKKEPLGYILNDNTESDYDSDEYLLSEDCEEEILDSNSILENNLLDNEEITNNICNIDIEDLNIIDNESNIDEESNINELSATDIENIKDEITEIASQKKKDTCFDYNTDDEILEDEISLFQ